jgi:hypothetical protein
MLQIFKNQYQNQCCEARTARSHIFRVEPEPQRYAAPTPSTWSVLFNFNVTRF